MAGPGPPPDPLALPQLWCCVVGNPIADGGCDGRLVLLLVITVVGSYGGSRCLTAHDSAWDALPRGVGLVHLRECGVTQCACVDSMCFVGGLGKHAVVRVCEAWVCLVLTLGAYRPAGLWGVGHTSDFSDLVVLHVAHCFVLRFVLSCLGAFAPVLITRMITHIEK